MPKVAIIGSGLIGRAWATVFCSHGWTTALYDPVPGVAKAAKAHIARNLKELADLDLVEDPKGAAQNLVACGSLAEALAGTALVQENGPETVEAKIAIHTEIDTLAPASAIVVSSTSFLFASLWAKNLKHRSRVLVAHPVNPPHLVPIVELCPSPWTDPKVVEKARGLYARAGQVPIIVRKEVDGFVLNRLQAVLMAEAFDLVGSGVVSPEDLDKTIRDGLGLRWSFMGPFETIELNAPGGIPDYNRRYGPSLTRLTGRKVFTSANEAAIMAEWPGEQTPERIARLSKWRDSRLAALKAHKRGAKKKPA
ncbi:3-hydroxyacyl-CoA dehydrogenase [Phreatobacter oligotrophus]|uniref:3-hydroxyacyl-CoA dehydrogenase n=1 Tax=Phreatobacter oligotrophus TaxID=1122261 RepID=UPI0023572FB9|nr:3-hydroxyacyl-CoA dehydrogenase [Phreatobacter oligotrophus]MBX9992118.1 3-hydroxyacyl-CoA dehydrogenase [Phreatobacter oligotrophus]